MKKILIIFEIVIILGSLFSDDFWASFLAGNVILEMPLLIPYIIFLSIKNKKKQEPQVDKFEKILDDILAKCKQKGSLEDIKTLKSLIEQNIRTHGSSIEFLELFFTIAKVYNFLSDSQNSIKYFDKVREITSYLNYEELTKAASNRMENNDFYSAVFFYTYILFHNKVQNNKDIPEIYYSRAIAYLGLKQNYYKNLAVEDLNIAIEKAKYVYEMFDNISEKYLTEKLEKYSLKLDEITGQHENIAVDVPYPIKEDEILDTKIENEVVTFDTEENKTIEEPINYGVQAYEKACKLMKKKNYESAIESFLTAFQYNVNTVDSLRNLAKAEKCLGNFQSAINYYKDVLKEEPNDAIAYNNIGNIYYQMNKYEEAFIAYSKAIEIDNNFDIAIRNREKIIKMREREQQKKADLLYEQARKDFNYKDYNNAKQNILQAIQLYNAQKYNTLKIRIDKSIENIESLYNDAILLINTGNTVENYQTALKMLKKVIVLNPNREKEYTLELEKVNNYIKIQVLIDLGNLSEAKQLIQKLQKNSLDDKKLETFNTYIENMQKQAENLYNRTQKYIEENNFEQAKICIQSALNIENHGKYKKLLNKIGIELASEKYYKSYLKELAQKHYIEAFSLINKALEINPKKVIYKNALKDVAPLAANKYFQNGQKFLEQKNYKKAIDSFNNAITLDSGNLSYYEQLEIANSNNHKQITDTFYKNSLRNLKNGNFEDAIVNIQQALEIYPDNEEYKEILEKANNRIVDIKTCNKDAILTLDGFNEEKAEQFINDRKFMNWYDIESFANHFNLQPHEMVMLEDRLIFPLKPQVKKGRHVDI